jgi:uncharacterized repeat protein (TIGR01451 family)
VVATPSGVGGSCVAASVSGLSATAGSGSVRYASGATIPAGGCTITVNVTAASKGSYVNTIKACDLKTNVGCNSDPATATLIVTDGTPNVFDPPSGRKTVTAAGVPVLEWRMVWINNGNADAMLVRVTDVVPSGTTFVAGSLTCTPMGTSTATTCSYDAANNRVVYEGSIGADPGATDEASAANEVVIVFRSTLKAGVTSATNNAIANWDNNGDGTIDDDVSGGQIAIAVSAAFAPAGPTGIPTQPPLALALLVLFIGLFGWRVIGGRTV